MSITVEEKALVVKIALDAFRRQRGIELDPETFDCYVDKPNFRSRCSIMIYSKTAVDHFRIKLYVNRFTEDNLIEPYKLLQAESYGPGAGDEIQIAGCTLNKDEFKNLGNYVCSPAYQDEVVNATNYLLLEEGDGRLQMEESEGLVILG